jgi:glycosyltransferase involved in cell wall biosynthesis
MRGISIVVPAFNSAGTLDALAGRVFKTLRVMGIKFELILVNDGSSDQTWEVIQTLVSRNDWVIGINLSQNFGQHNALLCGIDLAQFETCVTLDDDLQHPPEEIPNLTDKLGHGYELVYGVPIISGHSSAKRLGGTIARTFALHCLFIQTSRTISAFRAFRTNLREGFGKVNGPFVSLDALLNQETRAVGIVRIKHERRLNKESNYNFIKLAELSLTILRGFNPKIFLMIMILILPAAALGIGFSLKYTFDSVPNAYRGIQDISQVAPGVVSSVTLLLIFIIFARYLIKIYVKYPSMAPYVIQEKLTHPMKK